MPINWDDIANQAASNTDAHFANQISSLTRLNDAEIQHLIFETRISKQDLASVLKEIKDATKSNEAKVDSIKNISGGIEALVSIAGKFI
jgi:hypothetical protein